MRGWRLVAAVIEVADSVLYVGERRESFLEQVVLHGSGAFVASMVSRVFVAAAGTDLKRR